jgi:NAD(P)-dependent dehydrogenase (short-subunit alcohol dehydrogenase family)
MSADAFPEGAAPKAPGRHGMSIALVTGASSGFGAMTVRALADAGLTVYAGMRAIADRNAGPAADAAKYATDEGVDLRVVEMADLLSPAG